MKNRIIIPILILFLAGCSASAPPTPIAITAVGPTPFVTSTTAPAPSTATSLPLSATSVSATSTSAPSTATPIPSSPTKVPLTPTVVATSTAVPPSPTTSPAKPKTLAQASGQIAEANGERLTVNSAAAVKSTGAFLKAGAGNILVVLDITIENTGSTKLSYNPFYMTAKDPDGYEYRPSILGADKSLQFGDLAPGAKARGTITFEIPATAKEIAFTYDSPALLGGPGPITINLTIS